MERKSVDLQTKNLASIFRGLYFRVASRLGVDPSYVSRVARGERKSEAVEAALESETRKIVNQFAKKLKGNHNGTRRGSKNGNGSPQIGVNRRRIKTSRLSQN
jgi:DNA-binding transcriptional regulator YdaS (Cro superfamily)